MIALKTEYVALLDAMHIAYRALSGAPGQEHRCKEIARATFAIGQAIADQVGMRGMSDILAVFEDRDDMLAVSFLDHKWTGVKYPDGGVWCA